MGRIKTKLIKRVTQELYAKHKDELKPSFEENKGLISQWVEIPSKKLRNTIAGYAARLVKANKD